MALAIHFDGLIQSGAVANYAELAQLGNVTRARMTQTMNFLNLALEMQEELLFLPRVEVGSEVMCRKVTCTGRAERCMAPKRWQCRNGAWHRISERACR